MKAPLLLLAIAGCHSSSGSDPDASIVTDGSTDDFDSSPDDASVDGPDTGPITIQVYGRQDEAGTLIAGATIVVMDAGGTTLLTTTTDAVGAASATVPRDAMVTMIDTHGHDRIVTIVGVQPGDELRFGSPWTALPTLATMTSTLPTTPANAPAGVTYFRATRCSEIRGGNTVKLDTRCTSGTFDAYAFMIQQATQDGVLAWTSAANITPVNGGSFAMSPTWQPPATVTVSVTNSTPGTVLGVTSIIEQRIDGGFVMDNLQHVSAPSTSATHRLMPISSSELRTSTTYGYLHHNQSLSRRSPFSTQITVDATMAPSWLDVTERPTTTDRRIRWTQATPGAPDAILLFASYDSVTWTVLAPPSFAATHELTFPTLPAAFANIDLPAADDLIYTGLGYIDLEGRTWDQARPKLESWIAVGTNVIATDWRVTPPELTQVWTSLATYVP